VNQSDAAVLLLAGGLRTTPLEDELGLPTLAVEVSPGQTLINEWLGAAKGVDAHPISILTRRTDFGAILDESMRVVQDSDEYRGTGGAVRDAAATLSDSVRYLIVCEARRRPAVRLADVAADHVEFDRSVTVACSETGDFLGIYVIDAELLRSTVSKVGFQDLKEQWIGRVRSRGAVVGVSRFVTSIPWAEIHDREGLLRSVGVSDARLRYRAIDGVMGGSVGMVGSGASVSPGARVCDSLVMSGATVEEGALVYRSVLGPLARVRRDESIVNEVVA